MVCECDASGVQGDRIGLVVLEGMGRMFMCKLLFCRVWGGVGWGGVGPRGSCLIWRGL